MCVILCLFVCLGSCVVPLMTFLAGNAFFLVLDLTGRPGFMLKYKIQEDKGVPVSEGTGPCVWLCGRL